VSGIESKLAELAARFAARAPAERAAIADALAARDTPAVIDRAHKLAGIAGMFGPHEIGQAALALEEAALTGEHCAEPGAALLALLDNL
jgi:HPt (histidine-containing phosphotransfer) domain-containing protein